MVAAELTAGFMATGFIIHYPMAVGNYHYPLKKIQENA